MCVPCDTDGNSSKSAVLNFVALVCGIVLVLVLLVLLLRKFKQPMYKALEKLLKPPVEGFRQRKRLIEVWGEFQGGGAGRKWARRVSQALLHDDALHVHSARSINLKSLMEVKLTDAKRAELRLALQSLDLETDDLFSDGPQPAEGAYAHAYLNKYKTLTFYTFDVLCEDMGNEQDERARRAGSIVSKILRIVGLLCHSRRVSICPCPIPVRRMTAVGQLRRRCCVAQSHLPHARTNACFRRPLPGLLRAHRRRHLRKRVQLARRAGAF